MKKFVNLTAHPVNILLDGGDKITFPASGTIARVGMDQVKVGDIDGIPVFRTVFSKNITDLPAPADDTVFIWMSNRFHEQLYLIIRSKSFATQPYTE